MCVVPDGAELAQRLHQVRLGNAVHQTPDVHHQRGQGLMRVLINLLNINRGQILVCLRNVKAIYTIHNVRWNMRDISGQFIRN